MLDLLIRMRQILGKLDAMSHIRRYGLEVTQYHHFRPLQG